MTSFVRKLQSEKNTSIELVLANNTSGEPIYMYVAIPESEKEDFYRKIKNGNVDVSKLAAVIYSGFGSEPPPYVQKKISDMLNKASSN